MSDVEDNYIASLVCQNSDPDSSRATGDLITLFLSSSEVIKANSDLLIHYYEQ